eukprot:PhF_6_TR5510/c2_g1_i7/m.7815
MKEMAEKHNYIASIQPNGITHFEEVTVTLIPLCLRRLELEHFETFSLHRVAFLIQQIYDCLNRPKELLVKTWEVALPCIEELRACLFTLSGKCRGRADVVGVAYDKFVPHSIAKYWRGHKEIRVNTVCITLCSRERT